MHLISDIAKREGRREEEERERGRERGRERKGERDGEREGECRYGSGVCRTPMMYQYGYCSSGARSLLTVIESRDVIFAAR